MISILCWRSMTSLNIIWNLWIIWYNFVHIINVLNIWRRLSCIAFVEETRWKMASMNGMTRTILHVGSSLKMNDAVCRRRRPIINYMNDAEVNNWSGGLGQTHLFHVSAIWSGWKHTLRLSVVSLYSIGLTNSKTLSRKNFSFTDGSNEFLYRDIGIGAYSMGLLSPLHWNLLISVSIWNGLVTE